MVSPKTHTFPKGVEFLVLLSALNALNICVAVVLSVEWVHTVTSKIYHMVLETCIEN
jgi:hypothetical protein